MSNEFYVWIPFFQYVAASPTSPEVAELLAVARRILASLAAATAPRRRPASASAQ